MSSSADEPNQTCGKCGTLIQLVGPFSDLCAACLLDLGWDEEGARITNTERFDHYEVATHTDGAPVELGRGSMGITYRASDTILGNEVALKVIDARIAALPEARERFLREARAAARIRHPNLASVFYYGTRKSDGQCFYAMELVEGETLEARLRRIGPIPPALALEIITQVAMPLVTLDANGFVHRDLKPANLMLVERPELTVKVIDFGLAKAVAATGSESGITHAGFVGTPSFASPEQFANIRVDVRSDLVLRRDLEQLSSDAGAKLLRALGVEGHESELRSASDEFCGHCLALTLMGSYLADAYDGDIRCREEVSKRLAQDVRQGVHARKVMESYQAWFGEGPEHAC